MHREYAAIAMGRRYRLGHDPLKSYVGFVVEDIHYAVPIAVVREICNPQPVFALPHAPEVVLGVADVRGAVVPVLDVRVRFGLPPVPPTRRTKWIVIDLEGHLVALVVDGVTEVFGSGGQPLRSVPSLGGGEKHRGIAGVTSHGNTMVFVMDLAPLRQVTAPLVASGSIPAAITGGSLPPGGSS